MKNQSDMYHKHKLFNETFTKREVAASFIQEYLSSEIISNIDFESFEKLNHTFITKEMAVYFSDVLYAAQVDDKRSYFYFLFELEKNSDELVAVQLLKVVVYFLELFTKTETGSKRFPTVNSILLNYNDGEWNKRRSLKDLLNAVDGAHQYVPDFIFEEFNFVSIPESRIRGHVQLKSLITAHKHLSEMKVVDIAPELIHDIFDSYLSVERKVESFEKLASHLSSAVDETSINMLQEVIHSTLVKDDCAIIKRCFDDGVSFGLEKGINLGFKEGYESREISIVKKMAENDFEEELISDITGLPIEKIAEIIKH